MAGKAHFPVAAAVQGAPPLHFLRIEKQQQLPSLFTLLKEHISASDAKWILSCEHMSTNLKYAHQLTEIRTALAGHRIDIVLYIRNQADLAIAAYSTQILHGKKEWIDPEKISPQNGYFNYLKIADLWANCFGKDNLIIRQFERDLLINGDICDDFCNLVGIDSAGLIRVADQNMSLGLNQINVLRYYNRKLASPINSSEEWQAEQNIRKNLVKFVETGSSIKALLSTDEKRQVLERFREVNLALAEKYLSEPLSAKWSPDIYPPDISSDIKLEPPSDSDFRIAQSLFLALQALSD